MSNLSEEDARAWATARMAQMDARAEALAERLGLPRESKFRFLAYTSQRKASEEFGLEVRRRRLARHMTVEALSAASRVAPNVISSLESGDATSRDLGPAVVGRLAQVLGPELFGYRPRGRLSKVWSAVGEWVHEMGKSAELWVPPPALSYSPAAATRGSGEGARLGGDRLVRDFRLPSGGGQIRIEFDKQSQRLTCRLRDEANQPIQGWLVEVDGTTSSDPVRTDDMGVASIENIEDPSKAWIRVESTKVLV